jgi:hypothetical protein
MAADDKRDGSRFEKGDGSLFGTDHQPSPDRRWHSGEGGVRHGWRCLPGGDYGAHDSRPLFERVRDQPSGIDCSDARPDDGQEILSQIRV